MKANENNVKLTNGKLQLIEPHRQTIILINNRIYEEFKNREHGHKIFKHLLTQPDNEISNSLWFSTYAGKYHNKCKSVFNDTKIENDPTVGDKFNISIFSSLASIQWHMLKHCIVDSFMNKDKPYINILDNNETAIDIWERFVKEVKCERWGKFNETIPKSGTWGRKLTNVRISVGNTNCHGCYNCINQNGVDVFLNCCDFFKKQRERFIQVANDWIKFALQDNENKHYYKTEYLDKQIKPKTTPKRVHLHTENGKRKIIYAYIFQRNSTNGYDIYRMILKKNGSYYNLVTIYGCMRLKENKINTIQDKLYKPTKEKKCSVLFWENNLLPQFYNELCINTI